MIYQDYDFIQQPAWALNYFLLDDHTHQTLPNGSVVYTNSVLISVRQLTRAQELVPPTFSFRNQHLGI